MGNYEPIATIFLKLGQIQVEGVLGTLSDLEKKLSTTSLKVMIFQK